MIILSASTTSGDRLLAEVGLAKYIFLVNFFQSSRHAVNMVSQSCCVVPDTSALSAPCVGGAALGVRAARVGRAH